MPPYTGALASSLFFGGSLPSASNQQGAHSAFIIYDITTPGKEIDYSRPKLEGSQESQEEAEKTHLLLPTCPPWARPQQAEGMWSLCPKRQSSGLGACPPPRLLPTVIF